MQYKPCEKDVRYCHSLEKNMSHGTNVNDLQELDIQQTSNDTS